MKAAGSSDGRPTGFSPKPSNGANYSRDRVPMGYSNSRTFNKIQHKYQCIVTGQKRLEPCSGCTNQKGCLIKALQHKEQ